MTPEEYSAAFERAALAAGDGPDWNIRFLAALEANGLKLAPLATPAPKGCDTRAPIPVPGPDAYEYPCLVVPAQAEETVNAA